MQQKKNWMSDSEFVWSDNWCILEDEAWFVTGEQGILFCLDRKTGNTKFAKKIPERKKSFRLHPRCIKYGDTVFCLPDKGENIWCYHILADTWKRVIIDSSPKLRIACTNAWIMQDKIYIVSIGLKQILEIDVLKEEVTSYYNLPIKNDGKMSGSILVGNWIYIVGVYPVCIYKFDCVTKRTEVNQLTNLNDLIHTISYDGEKFWLSGRCRKIYIWKETTNEILILDNLPDKFGIWNFSGKYKNLLNYNVDSIEMPLFLYSSFARGYVWLIPAQSNEILYIDKDTYEINTFSLEDEELTEENINTQTLPHKYLLEYNLSERYVGLFSLKNRWIVEKLKYKILHYRIKEEHKYQIRKAVLNEKFYLKNITHECNETRLRELVEYIQMNNSFLDGVEMGNTSIGKDIFMNMHYQAIN